MKTYKNLSTRTRSGRISACKIKCKVQFKKKNNDLKNISSPIENISGSIECLDADCEIEEEEAIKYATSLEAENNEQSIEEKKFVKSKSFINRPLTLKEKYYSALTNRNISLSKSFNEDAKENCTAELNDAENIGKEENKTEDLETEDLKTRDLEIKDLETEDLEMKEEEEEEKEEVEDANVSMNNNTELQTPPTKTEKSQPAQEPKPKYDRSLLSYQKYPKEIQGIRVTKKFLLQSKGLNWKEVAIPKKKEPPVEIIPEPIEPQKSEEHIPEDEPVPTYELETLPNRCQFKKDVFEMREVDEAIAVTPEEHYSHSRVFLQQRLLNEHKPVCISKFQPQIPVLQESRPDNKVNHNNNSQGGSTSNNQPSNKMSINNHNSRKCINSPLEKLEVVRDDFEEPIVYSAKDINPRDEDNNGSSKKSVFKRFNKIKMKKLSFKSRFLQSKIPVWSKKGSSIVTEDETNKCEHARSEEEKCPSRDGRDPLGMMATFPDDSWKSTRIDSSRSNVTIAKPFDNESFKMHGNVGRSADRNTSDSDMVTETGCGGESLRKPQQSAGYRKSSKSSRNYNFSHYRDDHSSPSGLTDYDLSNESNNFKPTPTPKVKIQPKTRKKHLEFFKSSSFHRPDTSKSHTPSPVAVSRTTPQISPYRPPTAGVDYTTDSSFRRESIPTVKILRKCYPFQSDHMQETTGSNHSLRLSPEEPPKTKTFPSHNLYTNSISPSERMAELSKQKKDTDFNKIMKSIFKKQDSEVKDNLLKALLGDTVQKQNFMDNEILRQKASHKKRNRSESNRCRSKTPETPRKISSRPSSRSIRTSHGYDDKPKTPRTAGEKSTRSSHPHSTRPKTPKSLHKFPEKPTSLKQLFNEKPKTPKSKKARDKKEDEMYFVPKNPMLKYFSDASMNECIEKEILFREQYPDYRTAEENCFSMERKIQAYKKMFLIKEERAFAKDQPYSNKSFHINIRNYKAPPRNDIRPFQHWLKSNNLTKPRYNSDDSDGGEGDEAQRGSPSSPLPGADDDSLLANKFFEKLYHNKSKNNNRDYVRMSGNNYNNFDDSYNSNCNSNYSTNHSNNQNNTNYNSNCTSSYNNCNSPNFNSIHEDNHNNLNNYNTPTNDVRCNQPKERCDFTCQRWNKKTYPNEYYRGPKLRTGQHANKATLEAQQFTDKVPKQG